MRFLSRLFFTVVIIGCSVQAFTQARQLGTWRVYLPYNKVNWIFDGGDRVYCVTPYSLFTYEKSNGNIQTYDKATGLSDVGIQTANYDPASKFLVLAYTDNNMDLIYNGTDIYNLPDIQQYAATQAITIYGISFYNGNAYLSSSLGISIINLDSVQVNETFTIAAGGVQGNVYGTTTDGVNLYAATDSGVKYAPLSAPNIQDFESWQYLAGSVNLPVKKVDYLQAYGNKVYAVVSTSNAPDSLFQFNGVTWAPVSYDTSGDTDAITSLNVSSGMLYFTAWGNSPRQYGLEGKIDSSGALSAQMTVNHSHPGGWFENGTTAYEADLYTGFYINNQGNPQNVVPNGPFSTYVLTLNVQNGVTNVCPGGVTEAWAPNPNQDGFFRMKDGQWSNYNQYSNPVLANYFSIVTSASVPVRGKTYFGSYAVATVQSAAYGGLVEYDDNTAQINTYDTSNSILEVNPGLGAVDLSSLAVDQYQNLWMGNSGGIYPFKVLQADGTTWAEIQPGMNGIQAAKRILVDENNQVWAPCRGGTPVVQTSGVNTNVNGGLLVFGFNENNNAISYDSAMPARMLTNQTGYGNLPNGNVWCVAEDKSGNIWAGTDAGIATFYCPGNVLNTAQGGCDAEWIKVTLNGVVGYLFSTESVRALAVDAANRIWVGSTNGVWLISNDGQTTYLNFNSSNSPMPSSQVTDIGIDNTTGEVFIGTLGGLVSYQGDAFDTCIDCKEALVYPNPVTPDYTGPIAIKGLVDNAYVKITDISGTLIFQGAANGTQMIWNGMGYDGVRAKSGVYLVFASSNSGKSRRVAKILITN